eukprot:193476_1
MSQRAKYLQQIYGYYRSTVIDDTHSDHSSTKSSQTDSSNSNTEKKPFQIIPSFSTNEPSDSFIKDSHSPFIASFKLDNNCTDSSMSPLIAPKSAPELHEKTKMSNKNGHSNGKYKRINNQNASASTAQIVKLRTNHLKKKKSNKMKEPVTPPNTPIDPSYLLYSLTKNNDIMKPKTLSRMKTVPPKKMKKIATKKELEMVLEHYEYTNNRNIEQILLQHEPHIIEYRDRVYLEAKQNGITAQSSDYLRLKILGAVVEYTYMNIEPPDDYTKKTDRKHFKEVAAWSAKFCKNRNIIPPLTLIYAAWCHDIERFIPSTKCKYLPEAVDKYRKQVIHGINSSNVAITLLKGAPITQQEKDRIYEMILHHDIPDPRQDVIILNKVLIPAASDDIMWELEILMDADSFAFFQSTIYFFILFKSKKNSPDWIWERVINNVKRLRPHLREKASQSINKLPHDLLSKMSLNQYQLNHLCSISGQHSFAQSDLPSHTQSPDHSHQTNDAQQINENETNNNHSSNDEKNEQTENCELVDMKM